MFIPAFVPLIFHWYDGAVPPLMAVAVKVTGIPEHTGFVDAMIETLTGMFGLTTSIIRFEVA